MINLATPAVPTEELISSSAYSVNDGGQEEGFFKRTENCDKTGRIRPSGDLEVLQAPI